MSAAHQSHSLPVPWKVRQNRPRWLPDDNLRAASAGFDEGVAQVPANCFLRHPEGASDPHSW
jgi:hypothetical protein